MSILLKLWLFAKDAGSFVHLLRYVHPEGAACHAAPAMGTLRGMMGQGIILGLQFCGKAVVLSLIEHLVDACDGYALGAGGAVVAVGAVAAFVCLDGLHH